MTKENRRELLSMIIDTLYGKIVTLRGMRDEYDSELISKYIKAHKLAIEALEKYMDITPEKLAKQFHETYERLAPEFNYKTKKESAVPWRQVPKDNKKLMVAAAKEVLEEALEEKGENLLLRKLLWLRHGCPFHALYGDDGEMQCHKCGIDFKKDSARKIESRFLEINQPKLAEFIETWEKAQPNKEEGK